jgi:alpha-D-ribose 1-methylphosphonate 5-triphosphate synthase subunit PhnH
MDSDVLGHAVYRAVLAAMSRPGTVHALPPSPGMGPVVQVLGALLDHEASFCVPGDEALALEIRRATGGRPAPLAEADFVVFAAGGSGGAVREARRGSFEYPDLGATALYRVHGLAPEGGPAVLRGPGIRDRCSPAMGLPAAELELLGEVNREFPLGVDAIFLDEDGRVLCLPRSTRIEVG